MSPQHQAGSSDLELCSAVAPTMRLSLQVTQLQVEGEGGETLLHCTGRNRDSSLKAGRLSCSRNSVSTGLCFVGSHHMNGSVLTSASQWRARQSPVRVAFLDEPSFLKYNFPKYLMKLESLFSLVSQGAATLVLLDCCSVHVISERGFLREI